MLPGLDINPAEASTLLLLRARGPLRFSEVEAALQKNPATVDRALKALVKNRFVLAETLPGKGKRILVQYSLTRRGAAATSVLDTLIGSIRRHERELGSGAVQAAEALYDPVPVA